MLVFRKHSVMFEQALILLGLTSGIFCAVVPETDTRIIFQQTEPPQTTATNDASIRVLSDSARPVLYMSGLNTTHAVQQIFYGQWPPSDSDNNRDNDCNNNCKRKVTRDDYSVSGGSAHKLLRRKLKWGEGRKACMDEGGHMVVLNSLAEEGVVLNMMRSEQLGDIWLGAHDLFLEDQWITVTGESLEQAGYNKWEPNKPDNADGHENCAAFFNSGLMDDRDCDESRSIICEIDICKD